jgi:hypothetical protein
MADSKAIRAGKAFVEFFTEDGQLRAGMEKAEKKLRAWGKSVAQIGAGLLVFDGAKVAAGVAAAVGFAEIGTQLQRMSQRTGETTETLSALGYAAQTVGGDLGTIDSALVSVNNFMGQAASGSAEAHLAMARLGLDWSKLKQQSPAEQFRSVADGLSRQTSEFVRAQLGAQVLGGAYDQLAPLLRGGSDAIDAMTSRAEMMGAVLSGKDAEAAHEFHLALVDLRVMLLRIVTVIGASLAPVLTSVAKILGQILVPVVTWINANRGLVVGLFIAATAGVALGLALMGLSAVLGILATVVGIVTAAFSVMGAVIGFVLSPLGLIVIGIAAVIAAGVYFSGAWDIIADHVGEAIQEIAEAFDLMFSGIMDALKAGDIKLAMEILTTGVELIWATMISHLKRAWADFLASMVTDTESFTRHLGRVPAMLGQFLQGARQSLQANAPDSGEEKRLKKLLEEKAAFARLLANTNAAQRQALYGVVGGSLAAMLQPPEPEGTEGGGANAANRRGGVNLPASSRTPGFMIGAAGRALASLAAGLVGPALLAFSGGHGAGRVDPFTNVQQAVSTRGTFSGAEAAAWAGAGVSPLQRIADNTHDANETLERIELLIGLEPDRRYVPNGINFQ